MLYLTQRPGFVSNGRSPLRRGVASGWAVAVLALVCMTGWAAPLSARSGEAEVAAYKPPPGTIGLVISSWSDALYETPNAEECSPGLQKGEVEQFKAMPDYKEHLQTIGGNYQLRGPNGENAAFTPMSVEDPLPWSELTTKTGFGVNLDGTTDGHATAKSLAHEKFTSPDGEKVDNQMARVVGCILGYRTSGSNYVGYNGQVVTSSINRHLIEITGVDNEQNDPSVEVAIYKGIDRLVRNGSSFVVNQSHRIDARFPRYNLKTRGKIVNGVLITDPIPEADLPTEYMGLIGDRKMRDMVLRLKLTAGGAEGLLAGYESTAAWWNLHRSSILTGPARYSPAGLYRALLRYADGYPDPKTGKATYISAAYNITAVRAIIVHSRGPGAQ